MLIDEIIKFAQLQKNFYEKKITKQTLSASLIQSRKDFLLLLKQAKDDDKYYYVIIMSLLCRRLKHSLMLIDKYLNFLHEIQTDYLLKIQKLSQAENNSICNDKSNKQITKEEDFSYIENGKRNKRTNYPKTISKILKNWLRNNLNSPYPSETEKVELSELTGLDQTQINNWFINARRRILPILKNTRFNK
ncbi:homeodomain superfamily [Conglomerata obtusa]